MVLPSVSTHNATRFGPSPFMPIGGVLFHPLAWLGALWLTFWHSPTFQARLWSFRFAPWRHAIRALWEFTQAHPLLPIGVVLLAVAHVAIRYVSSYYAYNEDYLFVQHGLLSIGTPGGPFAISNDPVPFSTIIDAEAEKGLLGLLTGTGTLHIKTSESAGKPVVLVWVRHVNEVQREILARAGIRNARILSSISSG